MDRNIPTETPATAPQSDEHGQVGTDVGVTRFVPAESLTALGVKLGSKYIASELEVLIANSKVIKTYPHQSGDVTVIGPECIATPDGHRITWQGHDYARLSDGREDYVHVSAITKALNEIGSTAARCRGTSVADKLYWATSVIRDAARADLKRDLEPPTEAVVPIGEIIKLRDRYQKSATQLQSDAASHEKMATTNRLFANANSNAASDLTRIIDQAGQA